MAGARTGRGTQLRETRRRRTIDAQMVFFSLAGIAAALALPFLRFRPNRIAVGVPEYLARGDPVLPAALCLPWVFSLAFALVPAAGLRQERRALAAMAASIAASAAALIIAGLRSRSLAAGSLVFRVSLSSGFWVTILAAYASFLGASRRLTGRLAPARRLLSASVPILLSVLLLAGFFDSVSILREYSAEKTTFLSQAAAHAALSGTSVLIGAVLGILIGALSMRFAPFRRAAFFVLNIVQTIPSLALFGLLILPLTALSRSIPVLARLGVSGIGPAPALLALSAYAMLPIARNAYAALSGVPASLREAGTGMGMTRLQRLFRVEVPLAAPVILAGMRTAAVQAVGNTVVAALIGAGGLGVFIFQGLGQYASDLILLGTLPVIAMAILTDVAMGALVRLLTPRPMREAA
jgi:osmoprotectant transport system permease protein